MKRRKIGIGAEAARALEIWIASAGTAARLLASLARARLSGTRVNRRRLAGEALSRLCERLGPTYIKIGQILSSRPDLLPPDLVEPLGRLRQDVAPVEAAPILAAMHAGLGAAAARVSRVERSPVASASVAQVHRGWLEDGRPVAIKIRRPGIRRTVDRDFRLLRRMAAVAGRLPGLGALPLAELVRELEGPIRHQLDFERERKSLSRLRASFELADRICVPAPIEGLCTGSVLVMEYMEDLEPVGAAGLSSERRRDIALAGLRALYKMIFLDGLVHADLHPGNVFLRAGGELVLLDAGLVAELTEEDQDDFVDFFFGLVNNQGRECARIVWETASTRPPDHRRAAFDRAIGELVAEYASLRSRDFEITRFVFQLMDTQRRFGVRGSTKFIMTVLAMVVFDGICKQLYPGCDFQAEARPFLITARYRRAGMAKAS